MTRPGDQGSCHSGQFSSSRAEAPAPLGFGSGSQSPRKKIVQNCVFHKIFYIKIKSINFLGGPGGASPLAQNHIFKIKNQCFLQQTLTLFANPRACGLGTRAIVHNRDPTPSPTHTPTWPDHGLAWPRPRPRPGVATIWPRPRPGVGLAWPRYGLAWPRPRPRFRPRSGLA